MAVRATEHDDLKAEINVTPLVDVVLVLLITFMVVTPLLKQEVPIELPLADNSRNAEQAAQVTVTLAADRRIQLNGTEVPPGELVAQLTAMYAERPDKTIFLEADRTLPHGYIVDVMDDCRAAGVVQIGVITKKDPHGGTPAATAPAPAALPDLQPVQPALAPAPGM
ncbi:MAG: ExbD/TolR family protein [Candidatus Binatia bacterium]